MLASVLGSLDELIGRDTTVSIKEWVGTWIINAFGAGNTLKEITDDLFDQSRSGLITVAMMSSIYLASRGFTAAVRSLEVVYNSEQRRGWLSTRITGIALTVVTLVVISLTAATLAVDPLLSVVDGLADRVGAGWDFARTWAWLRWPALSVVVVTWVATIYHIVPLNRNPWRKGLPGSALCTVWWLSVSSGGIASGGVNAVFGILGGALSLLVWALPDGYGLSRRCCPEQCLLPSRRRRHGRPWCRTRSRDDVKSS